MWNCIHTKKIPVTFLVTGYTQTQNKAVPNFGTLNNGVCDFCNTFTNKLYLDLASNFKLHNNASSTEPIHLSHMYRIDENRFPGNCAVVFPWKVHKNRP